MNVKEFRLETSVIQLPCEVDVFKMVETVFLECDTLVGAPLWRRALAKLWIELTVHAVLSTMYGFLKVVVAENTKITLHRESLSYFIMVDTSSLKVRALFAQI